MRRELPAGGAGDGASIDQMHTAWQFARREVHVEITRLIQISWRKCTYYRLIEEFVYDGFEDAVFDVVALFTFTNRILRAFFFRLRPKYVHFLRIYDRIIILGCWCAVCTDLFLCTLDNSCSVIRISIVIVIVVGVGIGDVDDGVVFC